MHQNRGKWLIGGPEAQERKPREAAEKPVKLSKESRAVVKAAEGTYHGRTATQWRKMAQGNRDRAQGSFEACDTDGALAQWANTAMARKYELCARLAEHNGIWEFPALFTLTGALVPDAVYIRTSMGKWVWRIGKGATVAWFNESKAVSGALRRKNDAAKGFALGTIRTRAYVGTSGSGRGVAGALSVGYYIGRDEDAPIEIVDNGSLGTQYGDL